MRKHNFFPGPATLPFEVIQEAAAGLVDYHGMGVSIAEISISNADKTNAAIEIARQQREYVNGSLADFQTGEPISMALYS